MSVNTYLSSKEMPGCQAMSNPDYVAYHHRLHPGGDLYTDYTLPEYTSRPDTSNIVNLPAEPHGNLGTAYPQLVPMDDERGTVYKVVRFEARQPQSSVWVVKDTAWGTQPEGLNTDVARKLMSMGFNVVVKGPEINSSIPLSQSAWNTHAVLDAYQEMGYLDARNIAVEGYSRGSMVAFGTAAYAQRFGRNVLYLNLTDPCVALPVGIDIESAKKGLTLPLDIALLGAAALQSVLRPTRTKNLRGTIDVSIEGAKQFVRTGKPLMTGEAGMMAARTPEDMHATIAFFRHCRVNDAKVYRRILAGRPDVRFVRPAGGHGGGLDERIIGNMAVRFGRLGAQLREGRQPQELDYLDIIHGVKLARRPGKSAA
jgi:hypothetical protein